MAEHIIRLRAGWDWRAAADPAGPPRPVALPTSWPDEWAGRIRLTRRFGRPASRLAAPDRVFLVLEHVPGLARLDLNGAAIRVDPAERRHEIPLEALAPRNELRLEADPPDAAGRAVWGEIALVFRPV